MVSPSQFPNEVALRQKIENYLLNNFPRLYKGKQKCGKLQSYLDLIVKESTKEAENLIHRGMIQKEAWDFAIHHEINRTNYL
jgi:hypothetical protein